MKTKKLYAIYLKCEFDENNNSITNCPYKSGIKIFSKECNNCINYQGSMATDTEVLGLKGFNSIIENYVACDYEGVEGNSPSENFIKEMTDFINLGG